MRRMAALHQGDARAAASVFADDFVYSIDGRRRGVGFTLRRESGAHGGERRAARFFRLARGLAGMLQHYFHAIRKFVNANPDAGRMAIVPIAADQRGMA